MLCEEDQQLLVAARRAQVSRNTAIRILEKPNAKELIAGAFVRVLLELPSREEDYVVARVQTMIDGEPYSGFSTMSSHVTTKYLILILPPQLASINGTQYQLNSISNSTLREEEFVRWLDMTRNESSLLVPTYDELMTVAEHVRRFEIGRHRSGSHNSNHRHLSVSSLHGSSSPANGNGVPAAPPVRSNHRISNANPTAASSTSFQSSPGPEGGVNVTAVPAHNLGQSYATVYDNARRTAYREATNTSDGRPPAEAIGAKAPPPLQTSVAPFLPEHEDEKVEHRLRQDVLNHLSQECVLFPKDAKGYKLSRLRLVERDMIEYLQHVRDEIAGKQENCVICLDHVPTVILLPCKHKVLCRLCAPSCASCPVCRSTIKEMFEPEEI